MQQRLRNLVVAIAVLTAGALLAPAESSAQESIISAGIGGGMVWFGDLNQPTEELTPVGLGDGWIVTGKVEQRWGVIGARGSIGYTRQPIQGVGDAPGVDAWTGDVGLVIHPLARAGEELGVSPFGTAGIGFARYGFGRGEPVLFPEAGAMYPGDDQARLAWTAGGGIDFPLPLPAAMPPTALRIEFQQQTVPRSHFTALDGERHGSVHNRRITIGLMGYAF